MNEERRLNEANQTLLKDICHKVVKSAGSGQGPLDTVKQVIKDHGNVCSYSFICSLFNNGWCYLSWLFKVVVWNGSP